MSKSATTTNQGQEGVEPCQSLSRKDLLGNISDFLQTVPIVDDLDFAEFTNLKSGKWWAARSSEFGHTFRKRDGKKIFWKTAESEKAFYAELNGYRLLIPFLHSDYVHKPVGIDIGRLRIYSTYLEGPTLWELRYLYTVAEVRDIEEERNKRQRILDVILDVELRRHNEIFKALRQSTLFTFRNAVAPQDKETSLLDDRVSLLLSNHRARFADLYPPLLPVLNCTLDDYLSYSFVINEYEYGSLSACLSAASETITASALGDTVLAAGLGDGTCGNIILDATDMGTPFHFIDFEMAGLQNPFLDIGRSMFMDCFFTAAAFDLLDGLEKERYETESDCGFRISFKISPETRQIHITHNYWTHFRAPAWDVAGVNIFAYKYFNVVVPLVNHLEILHGKGSTNWEQIFGQSVFMTHIFRAAWPKLGSPRSFYLLTCIGMELFRFPRWLDTVFKPAMEKWGIEKQLL
jgi:hypothetical protein